MRRNCILIVVAVLLVMAPFSMGQAADKYELRFNHVLGPTHPYHGGFLKWAEQVKARTNGGLDIKVFHSAQLGVEEDILEQVRQGVPVGQNTDSARMGNYVPGIAVMNAPYFVSTIEEVVKLNQCPTVQKWEKQLADEFGFKVLSFKWVQGYRHFMTNKPIRSPQDLKGLRIRVPTDSGKRSHGNDAHRDMYSAGDRESSLGSPIFCCTLEQPCDIDPLYPRPIARPTSSRNDLPPPRLLQHGTDCGS